MSRLDDLIRFYELLARLEKFIGGRRRLADCHGRLNRPQRGVYFFFEDGETRSSSGEGSRVVRVGTHGLSAGSKTSLWNRLSQHRGVKHSGGGNHRGSIFRLLVGAAINRREDRPMSSSWGRGSDAGKVAAEMHISRSELLKQEALIEAEVSAYIGRMSCLWLEIDDVPGTNSARGMIEKKAIALLSNFGKPEKLDLPSPAWLGRHSDRERVRLSGLWNNNHVDEAYDPQFLAFFASASSPCRGAGWRN